MYEVLKRCWDGDRTSMAEIPRDLHRPVVLPLICASVVGFRAERELVLSMAAGIGDPVHRCLDDGEAERAKAVLLTRGLASRFEDS